MTCATFFFSHNLATVSTSSHARGAKQLVLVTTATIRSTPTSSIARSIARTFVSN